MTTAIIVAFVLGGVVLLAWLLRNQGTQDAAKGEKDAATRVANTANDRPNAGDIVERMRKDRW